MDMKQTTTRESGMKETKKLYRCIDCGERHERHDVKVYSTVDCKTLTICLVCNDER